MPAVETNQHIIRRMPAQIARMRAAAREARGNWLWPLTVRYANNKVRTFKRYKLI